MRGSSIVAFLQQAEANLALISSQLEDGPSSRGLSRIPRRCATKPGSNQEQEDVKQQPETEVKDQLAIQARTLLGFERRLRALERLQGAGGEKEPIPTVEAPSSSEWHQEFQSVAEDLRRELQERCDVTEKRLWDFCRRHLSQEQQATGRAETAAKEAATAEAHSAPQRPSLPVRSKAEATSCSSPVTPIGVQDPAALRSSPGRSPRSFHFPSPCHINMSAVARGAADAFQSAAVPTPSPRQNPPSEARLRSGEADLPALPQQVEQELPVTAASASAKPVEAKGYVLGCREDSEADSQGAMSIPLEDLGLLSEELPSQCGRGGGDSEAFQSAAVPTPSLRQSPPSEAPLRSREADLPALPQQVEQDLPVKSASASAKPAEAKGYALGCREDSEADSQGAMSIPLEDLGLLSEELSSQCGRGGGDSEAFQSAAVPTPSLRQNPPSEAPLRSREADLPALPQQVEQDLPVTAAFASAKPAEAKGYALGCREDSEADSQGAISTPLEDLVLLAEELSSQCGQGGGDTAGEAPSAPSKMLDKLKDADVEKPLEEHPASPEELSLLDVEDWEEHPDIVRRAEPTMLQVSGVPSAEAMSESIDATSDIDQDLPAELPELQFRAEPADLASAPRLCLEEERHQPSPRTTSSSSSIVGRVEQTSSIEPIRRISQEVPGPIDAHAARGSIDSAADAESESETSLSQGAPGIEPAGSKPAERAEARSGDGSSEIDELEACTSPANLYTAAETAHVALEGPTTAASSTEHGAVASIHGQTVEDGRGRKAEDESSYTYEESFSDPGSSTPRQREEEESLSEDASSEQDLVVALEDIESSSGSSSGRRPRRTEQPRILETE